MKKDKNSVLSLNVGVGIMGSAFHTTSVEENSKTTLIKRHGSMVANVIPSVIVICEDDLSKVVIEMVAAESKNSYKILRAGSWNNMPTLLYGIHVYREQLKASGDERFLEVVCVTDGDIRNNSIDNALKNPHKGNGLPKEMENALGLAKEGMYHLYLEHLEKFKGLPEYHHQRWLNEVSQEIVIAYHKEEVERLDDLVKCATNEQILLIDSNYSHINEEMAEVGRIVDASKQIPHHTLKDSKGKIDCHKFYSALKEKLSKGDTLRIYSLCHLEYSVLSIIKKYNSNRWQTYVAPVKEAMEKAFTNHVKMFSPDRFNLTEL